jgi:hypothetical protein
MSIEEVVKTINAEIDRLKRVRELLGGSAKGKRDLSPAGRAKIVAAQKKRWARLKSKAK